MYISNQFRYMMYVAKKKNCYQVDGDFKRVLIFFKSLHMNEQELNNGDQLNLHVTANFII